MIEALLGAAIAAAVCGWFISRRNTDRQRSASQGDDFDVPAKLRLLDRRGLAGRWRDGVLYRSDGTLWFRPRRPRVGHHIDLSGSTITGSRDARLSEKWWFAGRQVLQLDGPQGRLEVATGNDDLLTLARRQIHPGDP